MEFRVGVGEWNCRFFVSKFLTQRHKGTETQRGLKGLGVRGQGSVVSSQELEFSVGVGEWEVR